MVEVAVSVCFQENTPNKPNKASIVILHRRSLNLPSSYHCKPSVTKVQVPYLAESRTNNRFVIKKSVVKCIICYK